MLLLISYPVVVNRIKQRFKPAAYHLDLYSLLWRSRSRSVQDPSDLHPAHHLSGDYNLPPCSTVKLLPHTTFMPLLRSGSALFYVTRMDRLSADSLTYPRCGPLLSSTVLKRAEHAWSTSQVEISAEVRVAAIVFSAYGPIPLGMWLPFERRSDRYFCAKQHNPRQ